jgi:hypothetical protein
MPKPNKYQTRDMLAANRAVPQSGKRAPILPTLRRRVRGRARRGHG